MHALSSFGCTQLLFSIRVVTLYKVCKRNTGNYFFSRYIILVECVLRAKKVKDFKCKTKSKKFLRNTVSISPSVLFYTFLCIFNFPYTFVGEDIFFYVQ